MFKFYDTKTAVNGSSIHLSMPISKVDVEKRMVHGFATLDNIDKQNDVVPMEASMKAFEKFRGNLREQHDSKKAVGKVLSFEGREYYDRETNKTYNGVFVSAYVSKGAQDTWEKVLDGTLTGFSVGGKILDYETKADEETEDKSLRVIKDFELMELSLVDSPANQLANILSVEKMGDEVVTSGIATGVETQNVYWCNSDNIAIAIVEDTADCPVCKRSMEEVGWIETDEINKSMEIGKVLDQYFAKEDKKSLSVGDFVSWSSSGGTARGKIEKIVRSGSINVPGADVTINAEEDNPAVLIRIYRKQADGWDATDTRVGHKMSTLTKISPLNKNMDEDVEKEVVTSDNTPARNATQGNRGRVSEMVSKPRRKLKKKKNYKKADGDISVGDFVAYRENEYLKKGRVDYLNESLAEVRLFKEYGDKFISTSILINKDISELVKLKTVMSQKLINPIVKQYLEEIISEHNQKYGNVNSKKASIETLTKVYDRGVLAFSNAPHEVGSAKQWAEERVKGFADALYKGKFKRRPYDTDLLPEGHPLATIVKKEGGVEVANNETGHEELDTAQAVDEASVEEVEFEVEETIEGIVTEALAVAKADSVEAQEKAEDTSPEVFDMEKAIGDVKSFVEEAITKSSEASTESLTKVSDAVMQLAKAIDDKVGQLTGKYEELTKGLADLNTAAVELANRVETVEEDTAIKKSGELEDSNPEQPTVEKSLWGGRFLSTADL